MRAPVPDDPALPGLSLLLAPEAMAPFLHRSLGPEAPLPHVRIHHLRYLPARKAVVRYEVSLAEGRYDAVAMIAARPYLARRAVKPDSLALARRVHGRSPAAMPLHYEPELGALLHWYPLDLELPALAEPPSRLLAELRAAGATVGAREGEPVTLAYRPRRRAVLRLGEHVLKLYARRADFAAARAGLSAAARLRALPTAALQGSLPGRLVTLQPFLSGSTPSPAAAAGEAGGLLRELQAASAPGVPVAGPRDQLAVAEASARFLAALVPALAPRLEAFLRALRASVPALERLVLSHGDFSARQLLVTPDGLAVVDWDAIRLAPPALDPATYAAHLVFGGPDDLAQASRVLEELLHGYGGRPPGLSWYLATGILRHARSPFRYFDEHWPERVEGMVAAAEAALLGRGRSARSPRPLRS